MRKSTWFTYIIPLTVHRDSSEFNTDIRVIIESGRKKLLVNGIQQSGPMIDGFWNFAFSNVTLPEEKAVRSILILGVGGGTVVGRLAAMYPKAVMTGVDIDAAILRAGELHFGLSEFRHLKLVTADAEAYVKKNKKKYDFIIADLYIGRDIPAFESSAAFIRDVKKNLTKGGHLLINFLHDGAYKSRAAKLETLLMKEFRHVETARLPYNLFFMAYAMKP